MNTEQQTVRQIPWVRIDDQSVIANPSQNSLVLFNQTSTKIWQALRSGLNKSEIAHQLTINFQVSTKQAAFDVETILNLWRKSALFDVDINLDKPKRWQKDEPLDSKSLSDKKPLYCIAYQLNTYLFVVDYYQAEIFKAVHAVLKHLQINLDKYDGPQVKTHRYQIDYNIEYLLFELNRQTRQLNSIDELIEVIQWTLIENAYRNDDWLTVLHAAALCNSNQQAIVFVAQHGSGKSTLNRLLQNHDFIYLADDVVPINYAGELLPMPMCQRFKQGGWKILNLDGNSYHKTYARLEGQFVKYAPPLTGHTENWAKLLPVRAIVYPKYDSNLNDDYTLNELTNTESIQLLCQSGSVFGGAIDQVQLESIINWISIVPSYSLSYSDFTSELVAQISSLPE